MKGGAENKRKEDEAEELQEEDKVVLSVRLVKHA